VSRRNRMVVVFGVRVEVVTLFFFLVFIFLSLHLSGLVSGASWLRHPRA